MWPVKAVVNVMLTRVTVWDLFCAYSTDSYLITCYIEGGVEQEVCCLFHGRLFSSKAVSWVWEPSCLYWSDIMLKFLSNYFLCHNFVRKWWFCKSHSCLIVWWSRRSCWSQPFRNCLQTSHCVPWLASFEFHHKCGQLEFFSAAKSGVLNAVF